MRTMHLNNMHSLPEGIALLVVLVVRLIKNDYRKEKFTIRTLNLTK